MDYAKKLKDPRWQKKRLEILQRDEFSCRICGDEDNELHVHHKFYIYGNDPWDYDNIHLITLCADCHENEEMEIKEYSKLIIETLRKSGFMADDWRELASGINKIQFFSVPCMTASVISKVMQSAELQVMIYEKIKKDKIENNEYR